MIGGYLTQEVRSPTGLSHLSGDQVAAATLLIMRDGKSTNVKDVGDQQRNGDRL
jgi:hypothetical protein